MTEHELLASRRPAIELRCRILQAIRAFFTDAGFLEVQTPLRTPSPAPELHIDAIPSDGWFLTTSPELYMKRLLAAGYERIFQMQPVFRRGEQGRLHHAEFTLLEWYRLEADYRDLQEDCTALLNTICWAAGREHGWQYGGRWLEVDGSWERYSVREAFSLFAGWTPDADPDQNRFDMDMVEKVEPHLGWPRPCFLVDYPASQAALARLNRDDRSVAERFELYWAGVELANGFSELTDAKEQRSRFEAARAARGLQGKSVYPLPESFLTSLDNLKPCAGIALGLDRLLMLLADADHLDEVVAFPPSLT